MRTAVWSAARSLTWIALLLPSAAAADPPQRVHDLEQEVQALRGEVADLRQMIEDMRSNPGPQPAPPNPDAARFDPHSHDRPVLPDLSLGGFADVNYSVLHEDGEGTRNFFSLGDLDLFITSQLSDRISILVETLVEFADRSATVDQENAIDVERLLFKYEYADWLNLAAGRSHVPIGYWNSHFHHGAWLQTTVRRPLLFQFEDEGGILPLHSVGLEVSGNLDLEPGLLEYAAATGNGRGAFVETVQNVFDRNDSKMFAAQLAFRPSALPGLAVGANVLLDKIPGGSTALVRHESIRELIAGAYLAYLADPFEVLLEGQVIRHHTDGESLYSGGGYGQLAYRIGRFKPYYRFDMLRVDGHDPFYLEDPAAQDINQHTFGVRFDWMRFAALKLEYERQNREFPHDLDLFVGQLSFAF